MHHIYLNVDAECRSRDDSLSFALTAATGSKTANAGRFNICINYLTNQAQKQLACWLNRLDLSKTCDVAFGFF